MSRPCPREQREVEAILTPSPGVVVLADSSDRRNTGGIRELRWLGVGRVRRRRRRSVSSSLG
jgi:hypothetical protein